MNASLSFSDRIEKDYIQAYKAKDSVRLTVLRLLKTAAKNRLVELKRPGGTLADEEFLDLVVKEGKQRQDSIEQFQAARRDDLAQKEAAELAILREYLPAPLEAEELEAVIRATMSRLGASSPRDMGRVMTAIMAEHKGRVDGKTLSGAVKMLLQS
ncbi:MULTISPECIES: GatB/YqeY domain-containing protein [unclassified Desulfovibrio]|uniref:GatB/YqeY domain-containing protein n=1 Tax=unclassified Desulfovibrio TaxID=2593640 RepID=UPI000F5EBF21|nr:MULTISPECIES: GatB/YqeY domain-containing protein [unclassified Desulfovibrio]RRD71042.1 GatB/YqeY domain-containing protein [Desulfovibrio sp. OH1209_COT-279]RRD87384.1 GatB/YqeY domain-containing protein [Desulfovibrio sp. OH1186_COT-070]